MQRVWTPYKVLLSTLVLYGTAVAAAPSPGARQAAIQAAHDGAAMATTVRSVWPVDAPIQPHSGGWSYEMGTLLDGVAAEWQVTANGEDFAYVKAMVDRWVDANGTITSGAGAPFRGDLHSLDEIEAGRATLLCYRVTGEARYAKAAAFLHEQLAQQPRNSAGGYWHKQAYPQQMWLDGAYMAEPFRAAYAQTFQQKGDFDDIAHQLLLMDEHMRDPKTGLLRHGWDAGKQQRWADHQNGLSQEAWARAMGWYAMALVDALPWFPADHPQRARLIAALGRVAEGVAKYQDRSTGLWWDVMDKGDRAGNFPEASASAMFVYALAKGARLGLLPQTFEATALRGWNGLEKKFITREANAVTLHGTVKVSGLGGTPYRAGDYDYYVHEAVGDNDAKGVGAFLLAASEMQQAATEDQAQGKRVVVDAWFNSQVRKNAQGQTELFHYKWDDDQNSGFAFFGRAFQRYGARLGELAAAPTTANLAGANVFVIASPDIPAKNPQPNYMDKASGDALEAWVRAGGVLLLMQNDKANAEFEHFNTLSDRFGIHFNPVLRNTVEGNHFEQGMLRVPAGTGGIFPQTLTVYMKDICTIAVSGPAKSIYIDKGDTLMAVAHVGKGTVYAVTDPWLYNEYTDGRKLPATYQDFQAAIDLAGWALQQAR